MYIVKYNIVNLKMYIVSRRLKINIILVYIINLILTSFEIIVIVKGKYNSMHVRFMTFFDPDISF